MNESGVKRVKKIIILSKIVKYKNNKMATNYWLKKNEQEEQKHEKRTDTETDTPRIKK